MKMPPLVSPQEWRAAREELLVQEKDLTHARDALAAERRRMPRMAVEKDYAFDGPNGRATLADLFEGRWQLILYRFFFEPGVDGWPESGCEGCSWIADQMTHPAHLNARQTTLALISRAPQPEIERWKARMGWEVLPGMRSQTTSTRTSTSTSGTARTCSSATATRSSARTSSTAAATRPGRLVELSRHHRARAPGGVGGLAGRLPADARWVVELPRRVRRRRMTAHRAGVPSWCACTFPSSPTST